MEKLAIDWGEAAELMLTPSATVAEWERKFVFVHEAWQRVGKEVGDLIETATGEKLHERFGTGEAHL